MTISLSVAVARVFWETFHRSVVSRFFPFKNVADKRKLKRRYKSWDAPDWSWSSRDPEAAGAPGRSQDLTDWSWTHKRKPIVTNELCGSHLWMGAGTRKSWFWVGFWVDKFLFIPIQSNQKGYVVIFLPNALELKNVSFWSLRVQNQKLFELGERIQKHVVKISTYSSHLSWSVWSPQYAYRKIVNYICTISQYCFLVTWCSMRYLSQPVHTKCGNSPASKVKKSINREFKHIVMLLSKKKWSHFRSDSDCTSVTSA